jgi:putative component of membrane protein insertase Oxa1/YidC/SpoIIIJ protein YidD
MNKNCFLRCQFIAALFTLVLLTCLSLQARVASAGENPLNGPWDEAAYRPQVEGQTTAHKPHSSVPTVFFTSLLTFFQKVISPVDGDRCPSYPTCAAYSKQAYQKHGAIVGTLMTIDRLIHEASEAQFSPTVEVHGVRRVYDPVSANEFWKRDRTIETADAPE